MAERMRSLRKGFFCVMLLLALMVFCAGCASEETALITDYTTLLTAMRDAKDGDVLLVDDIDFRPTSPDVAYNCMCIEVTADVTVKSGKADGSAAVFLNGGFLLIGSKTAGEMTDCRFEHIVFDGCADTTSLTAADFQYPWSETEQTYIGYAPMKAQQAIACEGNVKASFSGCEFRGYMHEYGPVLDLRYGDYTGKEYITLPDYSGCTADILFEDCRIAQNAAYYDGGAIYIDANNNVTLTFIDTDIAANRSGGGQYREGGGAIKAEQAAIVMKNCTISDNLGNYMYPDTTVPDSDQNRGGALGLSNGTLDMVNCVITGNRSSLGGALSLTNMKADIDGCIFTENRAEAFAAYPPSRPSNNMAMGGALYLEGNSNDIVTLINCEISENAAAVAYGGIYGFYSLMDSPDDPAYHLELILCTYENNTVDTSYTYPVEDKWLWFSHPGDMTKNIHMTMFGCYMVDESFAADFPHHDLPTVENGYNYISGAADAAVLSSRLPEEGVRTLIGNRYEDKMKKVHVGSNYAEALYKEAGEPRYLPWIIGILLLLAAGCAGIVVLRSKMKVSAEAVETIPDPIKADAPIASDKKIVMTRYTDAEISRFLTLVPETQLLTGRELEVLHEILRGKKQGEVAHYLGIEVTTVKDFYKKIYTKLNVSNKDGLFIKAAEVLKHK